MSPKAWFYTIVVAVPVSLLLYYGAYKLVELTIDAAFN